MTIKKVAEDQKKIFGECIENLKSAESQLEKELMKAKEINEELERKQKKVAESHKNQVDNEVKSMNDVQATSQCLERAKATMKAREEALVDIQKDQEKLKKDFELLDVQRADLFDRQKVVLRREKLCEIAERRNKADMLRVQHLIDDHKLQEELEGITDK